MAVGDATDIAYRLRRYLPRWFGYASSNPTPVLDALLGGIAAALAPIYTLFMFVRDQARLASISGAWLDLAAYDYFGDRFPRFNGELDTDYRTRLRKEILRDRNTRRAISNLVFDLTGSYPILIYEGFYTPVNGGWGTPAFALGVVGAWGAENAHYEVIITIATPTNYGIPSRGGWGDQVGGWGAGNFSFVGPEDIQGTGPTQVDIIRAIDLIRTAGVTYYVRFAPPPGAGVPD